jgi:hypothetical protein
LLGLRVVNAGDDSLLSLPAAARRCTLVLVVGIGFAWGPLSAICMIMSLITARRMGGALWDFTGRHHVTAQRLRPLGILSIVVLYYAALTLQVAVVAPYIPMLLGDSFPEMKKQYHENPPWQLPKNSNK